VALPLETTKLPDEVKVWYLKPPASKIVPPVAAKKDFIIDQFVPS
jgi:hypothetical protein